MTVEEEIRDLGKRARAASRALRTLETCDKNAALLSVAEALAIADRIYEIYTTGESTLKGGRGADNHQKWIRLYGWHCRMQPEGCGCKGYRYRKNNYIS